MYSGRAVPRRTADWRGRVNVQLKGRTFKKARSTYSLKREALVAHQVNGGVLLFCVDVDLKSDRNVAQYAVLTPIRIREILKAVPAEQKEVAVKLAKLPRLPDAVERIVDVALAGGRQNPFQRVNPQVFEHAREFSVSTVDPLDLAHPVRLDPRDTAFVVEVVTEDGDRIPYDGGLEIMSQEYMPKERELLVSAGDAEFPTVTVQRVSGTQTRVTLCEGFSLTIAEDDSRAVNLNVDFQSDFTTRKRAIEFLVATADTRRLRIGDRELSLSELPAALADQVEEMKRHLNFLRKVQAVFDKFNADTGLIDLDALTDDHLEHLRVLHEVFINGAAPGNRHDETGLMLVNIGEWALMLVVLGGEEPGEWRYIDPFDPESPQMFGWAAEADRAVTIPITAYDAVKSGDLSRILNLRLDLIDAAYDRIAGAGSTVSIANERVRALLDAADAVSSRREEFLRGAERLNEWLIAQDGDRPTHLLNRLFTNEGVVG